MQGGLFGVDFILFCDQISTSVKSMKIQAMVDGVPVFTTVAEKAQGGGNQFLIYHDQKQKQMTVTSFLKLNSGQKLSLGLLNLPEMQGSQEVVAALSISKI